MGGVLALRTVLFSGYDPGTGLRRLLPVQQEVDPDEVLCPIALLLEQSGRRLWPSLLAKDVGLSVVGVLLVSVECLGYVIWPLRLARAVDLVVEQLGFSHGFSPVPLAAFDALALSVRSHAPHLLKSFSGHLQC